MNLNPGDLYFIRETDVLNGSTSPYCKVGLVKESRAGDADTRLYEHQTGNPRQLVLVDQVNAPAVSDLEASVHDRFATRRILGEWFELPDANLAEVVAMAGKLADEQRSNLDALQRAEEMKSQESTVAIKAPQSDDLEWFDRLVHAKALDNAVKAAATTVRRTLKAAIDSGQNLVQCASYTDKTKETFNKDKLAESHPEIYVQFVVVETRLTTRFTPKVPKDGPGIVGPEGFTDLTSRITDLVARHASGTDAIESLHLSYLELLGFQAQAKWDNELATVNLKASCGTAAGIDGLCTWSRTSAEAEKFDKTAFKKAHPDLYVEFSEVVPARSFGVRPMRSYRPATI